MFRRPNTHLIFKTIVGSANTWDPTRKKITFRELLPTLVSLSVAFAFIILLLRCEDASRLRRCEGNQMH